MMTRARKLRLSVSIAMVVGLGVTALFLARTGESDWVVVVTIPMSPEAPHAKQEPNLQASAGGASTQVSQRLTSVTSAESTSDGRVRGRIYMQGHREPARSARVILADVECREVLLQVHTDNVGVYEFDQVPEGEYIVLAWLDSWRTHSSARDDSVVVGVGEIVDDVDRYLVQASAIAGRIVDRESGVPVEGARVYCELVQYATTDIDGKFFLEGAPVGQVSIFVCNDRHATKVIHLHTRASVTSQLEVALSPGRVVSGTVRDAHGQLAEGLPVTVVAGNKRFMRRTDQRGRYRVPGIPLEEQELTIYCRAQGGDARTLSGLRRQEWFVEVDLELAPGKRVSGTVKDVDGSPIRGASIYSDATGPTTVIARTGADGRFDARIEITDVCRVTARKKGFAPATVGVEGETNGVEIILAEGCSVAGRVFDTRGNDVAYANVFVVSHGEHVGSDPSTWTDEEGFFELIDLAPADVRIGASKHGKIATIGHSVQACDERAVIVLKDCGHISGLVVDHESRAPVERFVVRVLPERTTSCLANGFPKHLSREGLSFRSDAGRFSIVDRIVPGCSYSLSIESDGYLEARVESFVAASLEDKMPVARIELYLGGTVTGIVVDGANDEPIPDCAIHHVDGRVRPSWRELMDHSGGTVLSGRDGAFRLSGLRGERGYLVVESGGYGRKVIEQPVPDEHAVIRLFAECNVEGTCMSKARCSVRAVVDGVAYEPRSITEDGAFSFEGLPYGVASIETVAGSEKIVYEVNLIPGQTVSVGDDG